LVELERPGHLVFARNYEVRNMKPKTMILMFVAVGCGLVASILTSRLIADRGESTPDEPKVTVLQVKKKILQYSLLKDPEEMFEVKEIPESAAPKKAIKSFDELRDKRVNRQLPEEYFITTDDLVSKDLNGLAAELRPGSRATAIRVNPESLAGGFVLPNSRVDIIWTSLNGETQSKNILQDMLILAVDQINDRDPERRAILGSTVTLACYPEEVLELATATKSGDLRLSLRPIGDTKILNLRPSKVADLGKQRQRNGFEEDDPGLSGTDVVGGKGGIVFPEPPVVAPPVGVTPPPAATTPAVVATTPESTPKEPEVVKHMMRITVGEDQQRFVFVRLKDQDIWSTEDYKAHEAKKPTSPKQATPEKESSPPAETPAVKPTPVASPAKEPPTGSTKVEGKEAM
jgi:pilus assembly protein CpaB